jgi:glucosamine-6-phosphate deaminase
MDRKAEIRRLLKLSPEEVRAKAGQHLVVCEDLDALHRRFAEDIAEEIYRNNSKNEQTRLILPVGPTGQYPVLAEIINSNKISLSDCWFFFMDENCGENGRVLRSEHPLSFKGAAERLFLSRLDVSCALQSERVIFPNEGNIDRLAARIEAFNEPEPGVKDTGPRRVTLNDFTVTINAVRSCVGGNLECFPRQAYTLGMKQMLGSKRIRLYCRNGCEFDWANTVLRLALFGTPGDDYPVTYIRDMDYTVTTDQETLASPKNLI